MNMNREIQKPLTPPKAFFDWCTSQIPTYEWKNKKGDNSCEFSQELPYYQKRLTKRSKLSYPTKFYSFGVILVSKKRIEIQSHCYWQTIKDGKRNAYL